MTYVAVAATIRWEIDHFIIVFQSRADGQLSETLEILTVARRSGPTWFEAHPSSIVLDEIISFSFAAVVMIWPHKQSKYNIKHIQLRMNHFVAISDEIKPS